MLVSERHEFISAISAELCIARSGNGDTESMNILQCLFRSLQCSCSRGRTATEQSEQWVVVALKLRQTVTRMLLGITRKLK